MSIDRSLRVFSGILLATTLCGSVPVSAKATYASKMEIGNLLFFNGDVDRAIRAFEEAAELNPKAIEPHTDLLNLYVQKGTPDAMQRAMVECQEILGRKPATKEVRILYGNLLRNQAQNEVNADKQKQEFDEALKQIEAAENLGESKAVCEYSIATVYLQKGDLEAAYEHITEALKEDPHSADAHLIHAVLTYKRLNRSDTKGATNPKDSPKNAGESPKTTVETAKPTVNDVMEELDLAIKEKGHNADAHNTKAEILVSSGDLTGAFAEYKKALQDDPHHLQALMGFGSCAAQLATKELDPDKVKDYIRQARDAFQQAKQIRPDDKNIVYALAVMLEKLGLLQEAAQEFRNDLALETDPVTRATIALHVQQLQQGAELQLNPINSVRSDTVGGDLFTSGALAIPFKNLIQVPGADKKQQQ